MSGGSFDYLYAAERDALTQHAGWVPMKRALGEVGAADAVAAMEWIERFEAERAVLLARIERVMGDERPGTLAHVLRTMEWWRSVDVGEAAFHAALEAWRRRSPAPT